MSNPSRSPLNPTALALAEAARALSQVGGEPVTEAMLRADIDAGAPTNPDGTLNLVQYAAWLAKEMEAWRLTRDNFDRRNSAVCSIRRRSAK